MLLSAFVNCFLPVGAVRMYRTCAIDRLELCVLLPVSSAMLAMSLWCRSLPQDGDNLIMVFFLAAVAVGEFDGLARGPRAPVKRRIGRTAGCLGGIAAIYLAFLSRSNDRNGAPVRLAWIDRSDNLTVLGYALFALLLAFFIRRVFWRPAVPHQLPTDRT